MTNRDRWNQMVLLAAGTAFGAATALSFVPLLSKLPDYWVSFSGSVTGGLVGGMLGLTGGWLAWSAVQDQIRTDEVKDKRNRDNALNALAIYAIFTGEYCHDAKQWAEEFYSKCQPGTSMESVIDLYDKYCEWFFETQYDVQYNNITTFQSLLDANILFDARHFDTYIRQTFHKRSINNIDDFFKNFTSNINTCIELARELDKSCALALGIYAPIQAPPEPQPAQPKSDSGSA